MKTDKSNPLTASMLDLTVANIGTEVTDTSELFISDANEQPNLLELNRKIQQSKLEAKITNDKLAANRHITISILTVIGIIVAIIGVTITYLAM